MAFIFLFLFLQVAPTFVEAGAIPEGQTSGNEQDNKAKCIDACEIRAKHFPTCHDTACKEDQQKEIKKCKADCEANNPAPGEKKEEALPPCVVTCIDLAKLNQNQCQGAAPCLVNVTKQAQECAQKCYQDAMAAGEIQPNMQQAMPQAMQWSGVV